MVSLSSCSVLSMRLYDIEARYSTDPPRVALIARNHEPEGTFATVERFAVAPIDQHNGAVAERGIKLGEWKQYLVSVGGLCENAERHVRTSQILAEWSTGLGENRRNGHACVAYGTTFLVDDVDRLLAERGDVTIVQNERIRDFATDRELRDRRRRKREHCGNADDDEGERSDDPGIA